MRPVSYVNIGIHLKIFLSKSTWSIENNSTLIVIEWPSTKVVHIFIGWKTWLPGVESVFLIWKNCYKSSCQNTTWPNYFRNITKVLNSLDPNSFGPNCLQMLSVEKTLARVKRSCQKFLGYLKKNHHIWSLVLLYHDCSNYVNLS